MHRLIQTGLRIEGQLWSFRFRAPDGRVLGRLDCTRNMLSQARDQGFLRRVKQWDVEARDLDTWWKLAVSGEEAARIVHLFPHNFMAEGSPKGRGFEVRDGKGHVIGVTDQVGRFLRPVLEYRDGTGQLQLTVERPAFAGRLSVADPQGDPVADFGRDSQRVWHLRWLRADLDDDQKAHLAGCLAVATLWSK